MTKFKVEVIKRFGGYKKEVIESPKIIEEYKKTYDYAFTELGKQFIIQYKIDNIGLMEDTTIEVGEIHLKLSLSIEAENKQEAFNKVHKIFNGRNFLVTRLYSEEEEDLIEQYKSEIEVE
jgi:hypothetical protein